MLWAQITLLVFVIFNLVIEAGKFIYFATRDDDRSLEAAGRCAGTLIGVVLLIFAGAFDRLA